MKVYRLSSDTIEQHQWGDPLLRHLTDKILKLVDVPGGRALDVGCGAGRLATALGRRGFQVDGVDVEERVVEQAGQLAAAAGVGARFFVADFTKADTRFADEKYDLVVCSEVLEHVEGWRDVVANIARVLKPGGLLVLTTPNDPGQFSILDEYAGHVRRFRWDELKSGLGRFSIEKAFTVGFPLTRTLHWTYTRVLLPLFYKEHSPERMWQEGSLYRKVGAEATYRLAQIDDLFNSWKLGTTWVVKARKLGAAAR
jgi:SAM-dependent methyltransferase